MIQQERTGEIIWSIRNCSRSDSSERSVAMKLEKIHMKCVFL